MGIKITDIPQDVEVTHAEFIEYARQCEEANRYTTRPVDLETFIRRQQALKKEASNV